MIRLLLTTVLLAGILTPTVAQEIQVSGKITSAKDGTEIPGVNIRIKGTTRGAVADFDGKYTISVASPTDTLVFSFIGFATQQIVVGQRTVLNVQLEPDATELEEVVITGFQEVDRKLFTGASVNVKMSDIKSSGMTDASRMLEGRVAGVTVDNISGTFGTSPKVRVRGNTSINGDTNPLWVVDGVILEDLNVVGADDISSLEMQIHSPLLPLRG